MNRQLYSQDGVDFEDEKDEYEDYGAFLLSAPRRSSIRRKRRFPARELVPEFNSRGRRNHSRQSIRTDAKFWEV
jgi:hypothetical protein